jgi:hypothetical protein
MFRPHSLQDFSILIILDDLYIMKFLLHFIQAIVLVLVILHNLDKSLSAILYFVIQEIFTLDGRDYSHTLCISAVTVSACAYACLFLLFRVFNCKIRV